MKNLITRALTGAIYVAVIVAGVTLGPVPLLLLCCLLAGLGMAEFYRLANCGRESLSSLIVDIAGGLVLVNGFHYIVATSGRGFSFPYVTLWGGFYLIYMIARLVMQLYTHEKNPLQNLAYSLMGQLYVALPVAMMALIYNSVQGHALLLATFIMIWVNDTGAYLVGSQIGRHRLFERISPKKSWEGFWGGLAFSVIAGVVCYYGFPQWFGMRPLAFMIAMGVVVSVFATWGDLVESLIKRTLAVKDSGHLLPGHGGILDRIDSLLLVIPAMVVLLAIMRLFF